MGPVSGNFPAQIPEGILDIAQVHWMYWNLVSGFRVNATERLSITVEPSIYTHGFVVVTVDELRWG